MILFSPENLLDKSAKSGVPIAVAKKRQAARSAMAGSNPIDWPRCVRENCFSVSAANEGLIFTMTRPVLAALAAPLFGPGLARTARSKGTTTIPAAMLEHSQFVKSGNDNG